MANYILSQISNIVCFQFYIRRETSSLEYPFLQVSVQPFVLRSQLYSSLKDRTQVDRELEVIWFF